MAQSKAVAPKTPSLGTDVTAPLGFQAMRREGDRVLHATSPREIVRTSRFAGPSQAVGYRVDLAETEGAVQVTAEQPGSANTEAGRILPVYAEVRPDVAKPDSAIGDLTVALAKRAEGKTAGENVGVDAG